MDEQRTRNFAESGVGIVDIDGVRLHARWRMSGTQQYVVGAGAALDGRRGDIAVEIYFDKMPEETELVQELLGRITADPNRPLAIDLGRSGHPGLYCVDTRTDQSGNPTGMSLGEQPSTKK